MKLGNRHRLRQIFKPFLILGFLSIVILPASASQQDSLLNSSSLGQENLVDLTKQLQILAEKISTLQGQQYPILLDSVTSETKLDTVWVIYERQNLWPIITSHGILEAQKRADFIQEKLNDISIFSLRKTLEALEIVETDNGVQIVSLGTSYCHVTLEDAIILNKTPKEIANQYIVVLKNQGETGVLIQNNEDLLWRMAKVLIVIFGLFALVKLLNIGYRKINRFIVSLKGKKVTGFTIRNFEIINDNQVVQLILFVTKIIRLIIVLLLIYISLPIVFGLFPWTEPFAEQLLGYVINPVQEYFWMFINYIPNLISIGILTYIGHFILKFINYLSSEVENENLTIAGFYPEWVKPTANLAKFAIYIILLIFIFPFLPGSDSPIFKGVSVFVGIIITMGSSSSINNIVAGLVLTYMRPFKIGDRIKVEDVMGFVTEKNLLVTRVRTSKQEIVTIPNSKILNTNTINYSISIQENDGVIVHNSVTLGYDVPWRKVHKALLKATESIESIAKEPKPFVLQTSLDDFYVSYEINAYIIDVKTIIGTESKLNENIQDVFRDEGIEILSPHYKSWRDGQQITIPKKVKEDYTFKTEQVDDHTPELDLQKEEEEQIAKEKAKTIKKEMPKSFSEMIGEVDKLEKEKEEKTLLKEEKKEMDSKKDDSKPSDKN